jgi:hypothetical protein
MENEFKHLLHEFRNLNLKELPSSTFLDIIEKSHLENVWSRILAFYFDPNKVHRMRDLLIKSLFDAILKPRTFHSLHSYEAQTEYPTKSSNRIDIVLSSTEFVIGIENKVNAPLYNDLEDYGKAIKSLANTREAFLIVLSKYKIENEDENKKHFEKQGIKFFNLTYYVFLKSIRNNIGFYQGYADTKYSIFFLDFLDNIEKNLNMITMINNPDAMKFFIDNNEDVKKLVDKYNQITRELDQSLIALHSKIQTDTELQKNFREIIPNENFILEVQKVELKEGDKLQWVVIKVKDKIPEVICCTLYHDSFMWHADSAPKEKYKSIFSNDINNSDYYFSDLDPWTDLEIIKKKFLEIILLRAAEVQQCENDILEISYKQ